MLLELSDGKREVVDKLLPMIYDELKRIAASYLRRERSNHTLQRTAAPIKPGLTSLVVWVYK